VGAWIWPAVRLSQIDFCFDTRGAPLAYATWAFLSDEVSIDFATNERRLLHLSEWNEGANLWIIDVVSPVGAMRMMAARLKQRFRAQPRVRALHRGEDGAIRRVLDIVRHDARRIRVE
jgi:hemolysin-activating ACP:hemolysin acyltransferase